MLNKNTKTNNMNRNILLLAAGFMLSGKLSAQERTAVKDTTFVDHGVWVNEMPPPETIQDRVAREAKDKTWVDKIKILSLKF